LIDEDGYIILPIEALADEIFHVIVVDEYLDYDD